jgi:regulator of cell morphogenesis and NO signaling
MTMEASNILKSAPLQQLRDEHVSLRGDMDLIYEVIEEIEFDSGYAVVQLFAKLHKQILAFHEKLTDHSNREEEGLFPMMDRRLGENDRTITTMEEEHDKAERHLQDFLTEARRAGSTIDEDEAQTITVYTDQALATLTQHFAKEERTLFPLAEKILTDEEKKELERLLQAR